MEQQTLARPALYRARRKGLARRGPGVNGQLKDEMNVSNPKKKDAVVKRLMPLERMLWT